MVPSSCSAQQRAGGRERRPRALLNWACLIPPVLLITVLCLFMNLLPLLPRFCGELSLSCKSAFAGWLWSSSHSPKPAYGSVTFNRSTLVSVHWLLNCRAASQDSLSTVTQPWFKMSNRAQKAIPCLFDPGFLVNIYVVRRISELQGGDLQRKEYEVVKSNWNNNSEINLYQERTAALLQDGFRRAIFCPATSPWLPPCTI